MKKIIFILSFTFICIALGFSQTEKGNFIIGGSSNFSFASEKNKFKADNFDGDDGDSTLNISFAPTVGYFATDNLAIGLQTVIGYSEDNTEFGKIKTTSIAGAPFIRYYFSNSKIRPFLQGTVGIGSSKSKFDISNIFSPVDPIIQDVSNERTSRIFTYGFDGGVAIFINPQISVDLGIGYVHSSSKAKENNTNNSRFISNIIGFNAGFNIFL